MDDQDLRPVHATPPRPDAPNGSDNRSGTTETAALAPTATATTPLATDDEATIPLPPDEQAENPVLDRFWIAVRRLPSYVKLAVALGRDPRVPKRAKAILSAGAIYTLSPLDLIPGIIPVAGQLDDLLVMLLALRQATHSCPPALAAEHLSRQGLTATDIDSDLAATRDTVVWLAKRGAQATARFARRSGRFLRSRLTSRFAARNQAQ